MSTIKAIRLCCFSAAMLFAMASNADIPIDEIKAVLQANVTSTAPDYEGPPVTTRPIVGGTGDFAGARGVVKTSADPKGIRVDITLN